MTFAIKEKIEKQGIEFIGKHFDKEPYNYIFNKGTAFLDGDFIMKDYK